MTNVVPELKKASFAQCGPPDFPATGYVRVKQILAPIGPLPISRSSFWAGVKTGKFPQPRKISTRVTVWRAEDIHALIHRIEMEAGYNA